jgi:hypothetical protein
MLDRGTSWDGVQGSGILPNGKGWGFTNLQYVGASGMGAFCYKDGLPTAWTNWNHRSDIGNAEEWEYVTPALYYLGRRLVPEYCGHGKYRGAIGHSAVYVILNPGRLAINRGGGTGARNTVIANGMCGGYPAPGVFIKTLHGTNMRELMARGEPYRSSPWELDEFVASGRLKAARSTAGKRTSAARNEGRGRLRPGRGRRWRLGRSTRARSRAGPRRLAERVARRRHRARGLRRGVCRCRARREGRRVGNRRAAQGDPRAPSGPRCAGQGLVAGDAPPRTGRRLHRARALDAPR